MSAVYTREHKYLPKQSVPAAIYVQYLAAGFDIREYNLEREGKVYDKTGSNGFGWEPA